MSDERLRLDYAPMCREGVFTVLRWPVRCCRRCDSATAKVFFTACSWAKRCVGLSNLVQLHHPQTAIEATAAALSTSVSPSVHQPHVLLDFNGEDGQIVVQVSIAAPSNDFFLQRLNTLAK